MSRSAIHVAVGCIWVAVGYSAEPAIGQEQARPAVATIRVPGGGIQPQVATEVGVVHLVYYTGDPHAGDVFYVRSTDEGKAFGLPSRVNSQPGSAVAVGTIRGPQLAVGKGSRVHVAWIGSKGAKPRAPEQHTPVLYSRMSEAGTGFEPQRNLIQERPGVDAGFSIAADGLGNVYVTWHAPGDEGDGEQYRKVWVARSSDDGATFSVEKKANTLPTGACVCCGMKGYTDSAGNLYVLYRSANRVVNRDTYLVTSADGGDSFRTRRVHKWTIGQCMMSAADLVESPSGVLAAWETRQQVYVSTIDPKTFKVTEPVAAPGKGPNRKHPALAANRHGDFILAWTEGTAWAKGGSVAWQVFDKEGQILPEGAGRTDGVPAWSAVAVFVRPDGSFAVVY